APMIGPQRTGRFPERARLSLEDGRRQLVDAQDPDAAAIGARAILHRRMNYAVDDEGGAARPRAGHVAAHRIAGMRMPGSFDPFGESDMQPAHLRLPVTSGGIEQPPQPVVE